MKLIISNFLWLMILVTSCNVTDSGDSDIALNLKIYQQNFSVADTLLGTFNVTNYSIRTVNFRFSSSCQYGLIIKSGNTVYRQLPEVCAAVLSSLTLKSGESKQFEIRLPLVDQYYKYLPQGSYEIEAFLLNNNSSSVRKNFRIN
ncbi:MAG: hypothetical protein IPM14_13205 [bacterium]|nr:hypothetical protein [bacterium]